jgi:hypothetical protein
VCVLFWGGFSSPGAGGLFRGCHVAARLCPRVSVETPPPSVDFSSRPLKFNCPWGGGAEERRRGLRPEAQAGVQGSLREGETRVDGWGAPEGRGTGTRGEGGKKGGGKLAPPPRDGGGTRSRRVQSEVFHSSISAVSSRCPFGELVSQPEKFEVFYCT